MVKPYLLILDKSQLPSSKSQLTPNRQPPNSLGFATWSLGFRASLGFSLDARHDLFAHVVRGLLVAIEVHRIRGAPLRARTQVGGVAEHLGEGHARVNDLRAAAI